MLIEQYFQISQAKQPYRSHLEYQNDIFSFLDLLLLLALEVKESACEQPIYLRGSAITFQELAYALAPRSRRNEQNEVLMVAYDYIKCREQATTELDKISPLAEISHIYKLNEKEKLYFYLLTAPEYEKKYERIVGFLEDNISVVRVDIRLVDALTGFYLDDNIYYNEHLRENTSFFKEVLVQQDGQTKIRKRVISYLNGEKYEMNEEMKMLISKVVREDKVIVNKNSYDRLLKFYHNISKQKEFVGLLPCLLGKKGTGKHLFAASFCKEHGYILFEVFLDKIGMMESDKMLQNIHQILLECKLQKALPYIDISKIGKDESASLYEILNLLFEEIPILFLGSNGDIKISFLDYPIILLDLSAMDIAEKQMIWKNYAHKYDLDPFTSISELASQYQLTAGQVKQVMQDAYYLCNYQGRTEINYQDIWKAVTMQNQAFTSGLVTKIDIVFSFDDLVIKESVKKKIKLACSRLKYRHKVQERFYMNEKNPYGRGTSILMYGPPGTGKTMTAQIIAAEVGMSLYRVDLSQVSSKYIGETEKNLNTIFEQAKEANGVLFFDEADAFFSKRTDIKDSHDKHANAQTSFLLQKMEEFDGMCLLATNLNANFDQAFMRRITFLIEFELPDEELRYKLWTQTFEAKQKTADDVDFHVFAKKLELSAASIKAVLYNAALLAVEEDTIIFARHLIMALRYEYEKIGRIFSANLLEEYAYLF